MQKNDALLQPVEKSGRDSAACTAALLALDGEEAALAALKQEPNAHAHARTVRATRTHTVHHTRAGSCETMDHAHTHADAHRTRICIHVHVRFCHDVFAATD